MMRTGQSNLEQRVRMYMEAELDESEQDLFFYDLDSNPALRAAAWDIYTRLNEQQKKANGNDTHARAA